jgi:CMP/dCMP kinase
LSKKQSFIITVDGPSASGKTSVSRELARRLGCAWVSTGAFYRGLAFAAMQLQIPLQNESELCHLASQTELWQVKMTVEDTLVFYKGKDVTSELMGEQVGAWASQISQYATVRESLLRAQRQCWQTGTSLVAEGRDCGSVVFPKAELKFYLTADLENRAHRRALEQGSSAAEVAEAQAQRDRQDSTRTSAPLMIPKEGRVVDTTFLDLRQVVDELEKQALAQGLFNAFR